MQRQSNQEGTTEILYQWFDKAYIALKQHYWNPILISSRPTHQIPPKFLRSKKYVTLHRKKEKHYQ